MYLLQLQSSIIFDLIPLHIVESFFTKSIIPFPPLIFDNIIILIATIFGIREVHARMRDISPNRY